MAELAEFPAQTDEEILSEARKRLALASDAESPNRTEALTDLKFGNGDQWPVDIQRDRETDGRPALTINITDAMVRRVCNSLRENRPRIKPHPVGSGTNVQDAQAADGVIRHIEVSSGADYAYDCAVESAVRGGWGYFRIGSKYIDDKSFDQDLTIEAISNPFTVYKDPASRMPDGSDMNWCLVSEWITRSEYQQKYGDGMPWSWTKQAIKTIGSAFNFLGTGDEIADWSRKEELRLAEYWRVVVKKDTLSLWSNGATSFKEGERAHENAGLQLVRTRQVYRRKVEWYLLSGDRVLDRREWPGKWIPIIAVYGRATDLNGKIVRKGMIRDLRDPARMFNYSETAKTEIYALQPKAPWLGPEGFMAGHEPAWRDANRKPIAGLEYTPTVNSEGQPNPPPERQMPPAPAAGFAEWSQSNQANFLFVAGMPHEPDADKQGEVVSGIAIKKREGLSDISHFDFYDNEVRSMRHAGHVLVDLFPYFYDTRRIQTIIKPDGKPDQITLNDPAESLIRNNLKTSNFGIVIDTGPSYATQREESAEAKLELMSTPLGEMVGKAAGDLIIRGMNFENADEIADRLQALIPGAQIDKDSDLPPKAQILIAGLQAQLKQDRQQLLAAHLEIEAKHGLQKIKEDGENQRLQVKEAAETERTRMELGVRREDSLTKAHTSIHDTHVKSVTAHDVAEIQAAGKLLDSHAKGERDERMADKALEAEAKAEKKDE